MVTKEISWLIKLILNIHAASIPAAPMAVVVMVAKQGIAVIVVVKMVAVSIQRTAVHRV